jgi:signal transduction histidine kinase
MNDNLRVFCLIITLLIIAVSVGGFAIVILYEAAVAKDRSHLSQVADGLAQLVQAVADSRLVSGASLAEARRAVQQHVAWADWSGWTPGATGELAFAVRDGGDVIYLVRSRQADPAEPLRVPAGAAAAEAMRRALVGEAGTLIGSDFSGKSVLVAYRPVNRLQAGLVVKIDSAEIRAPFIRAATAVVLVALVAIALGSTLFLRLSEPLVRALQARERRFRSLFDNMSSGALLLEPAGDSDDYVIRDANQAACAMELRSRAQLLDRLLTEVLDQAAAAPVLHLIRRVWSSGAAEELEEVHLPSPSGAKWRSFRAYRLPAGEVVCLMDDITARRTTEEHLRQALKLEALGQLTGGIAHDFNNVLAIISGNLELLKEQGGFNAECSELLSDALWAAERGAELTHRLLAYARRQPLTPALIDVNGLIRSMASLVRRSLGPSIEVRTLLDSGLWPVLVDPGQLQSALVNLIVNARDAMPAGGELTIETCNVALDAGAPVMGPELVSAGDYVMIDVRDTGHGISDELQQRIFEPFFTTKGSARGSGLGLSMVYGFVKQSGGHVRVVSASAAGTSLTLFLPRADPSGAVTSPVAPVAVIKAASRPPVVTVRL